MIQLTLILPVYQQADIIGPVFRNIHGFVKKMHIDFECILVENGSTDGTEKTCADLAKKFPRTRLVRTTKGYGSAVLAGLSDARGTYVCYMPSDGQIDLSVLPELWNLSLTGTYHIVKVRRANRENTGRWLVSKVFSQLVAFRFRTPVVDINGSPRILRRNDMESLALKYTDSFIDAEMLVKAARRGWSIAEIPMKNLPRYGGSSSRSWRTFAEFLRNMITFRPE